MTVRPTYRTIDIGDAWATSTVNCVPFRYSGLTTHAGVRYLSFYNGSGAPVVVRRDLTGPDSSFATCDLPPTTLPFDAHRSISIAVGDCGRLYAAYGAHASSIVLTRSKSSDITDGFETIDFTPGSRERSITYPMFFETPGRNAPMLLFRDGTSASGALYTARWLESRCAYLVDEAPILDGRGNTRWPAGPYVNTPATDQSGRVALFYVWRVGEDGEDPRWYNSGLDFAWANAGLDSLSTADGSRLPVPVTPTTTDRVFHVPRSAGLINQAGAAVRYDGVPMALTYWSDPEGRPQYRLVWRDGVIWRHVCASHFTTVFEIGGVGTLPLPHSRPELLVGRDGIAYCIFRSSEFGNRLCVCRARPPDYDFAAQPVEVLVDQDLGFYEPVIDRSAWALDEELVAFVQHCAQAQGDGVSNRMTAPAFEMSWRL